MPAEGKVSLVWQIIMVLLIPIAGIWAFYRIKKLTKAFLYIIVPEIALMVLIMGSVILAVPNEDTLDSLESFDDPEEALEPLMFGITILSTVVGLGLTGLAIYLIIKWTEEWNNQFP